MLKKFGEEKLNWQLRQHFAEAVDSFAQQWTWHEPADANRLLDQFFDHLGNRAIEDAESFRVRLLPLRWQEHGAGGGALLLSLYEPELRFQKAVLFRARASLNGAPTEEGNLFDTRGIREEAAEMLQMSQSACFATFSPQGIHVISANSVLGDADSDSYLLKNFYYLNIADFVGGLFFKCFVGDTRPAFIEDLKEGKCCRNLLEFRISGTPAVAQRVLF